MIKFGNVDHPRRSQLNNITLIRLSSRDEEVDLNESDLRHHSSRAIPNDYGKEPNT